jgi:hypothetical protein
VTLLRNALPGNAWVVSNPQARRNVFYPSTIRPRPSSDQNATAFPQHHTANLGLTRSACGTTMRLKWLLERGAVLGLGLPE